MTMNGIERREMGQWLQRQGYFMEIIDRGGAPMLQWYKPNGEPIARLSKSDAYHMARYRERHWTMLAPQHTGPERWFIGMGSSGTSRVHRIRPVGVRQWWTWRESMGCWCPEPALRFPRRAIYLYRSTRIITPNG